MKSTYQLHKERDLYLEFIECDLFRQNQFHIFGHTMNLNQPYDKIRRVQTQQNKRTNYCDRRIIQTIKSQSHQFLVLKNNKKRQFSHFIPSNKKKLAQNAEYYRPKTTGSFTDQIQNAKIYLKVDHKNKNEIMKKYSPQKISRKLQINKFQKTFIKENKRLSYTCYVQIQKNNAKNPNIFTQTQCDLFNNEFINKKSVNGLKVLSHKMDIYKNKRLYKKTDKNKIYLQ